MTKKEYALIASVLADELDIYKKIRNSVVAMDGDPFRASIEIAAVRSLIIIMAHRLHENDPSFDMDEFSRLTGHELTIPIKEFMQ